MHTVQPHGHAGPSRTAHHCATPGHTTPGRASPLWRTASAALFSVLLMCGSVCAQDFPSRPIRIFAPQAAGGPNDILIRVLADKVKDTLRQPVVVENRPGTGGMIAAEALKNSTPDGHTLMLVTASLVYSALMMSNPPVDPLKDLAPVAMVTFTPLVLAVHSKLPVKNFAELVAYAKTNPDKLNAGVSSAGGSDHLAIEMMNQRAGLKITSIVYKGAAPALQDLVAGRVDMQLTTYAFFKQHIDNGTLRMIATPGVTRNPFVPDIPTFAELGYAGLDIPTWSGFAAPPGTPRGAIGQLSAAFRQALQSKDVLDKLATMSLVPNYVDADQYGVTMRQDSERVARVIRTVGLKLE